MSCVPSYVDKQKIQRTEYLEAEALCIYSRGDESWMSCSAAERKKEAILIKAVIFDFDGTLVDFVNSDTESLAGILSETNSSAAVKDFVDRAVFHIMKFHELASSGAVDPLTMHHYRLVNTFRDYGIAWNDVIVERYKAKLLEHTKPYPGAETLLRKLNDHVKLGILTNAYDPVMQTKRIRAAGLIDYFQCIQISGEEKYAKPDSQAYKLVCQRLLIRPEECVFVGNSPKYDIDGAIRTGMKTVLIENGVSDLHIDPDFIVGSIEEVEPILSKMIAPESALI